jgi:hypothetical protein
VVHLVYGVRCRSWCRNGIKASVEANAEASVEYRAYQRDTLGYACLHLPSLDAAWTHLDILAKAPITP